MTPLMQRGYDDQARGALDPALEADGSARGREYRDGARQRRRDDFDGLPPPGPYGEPGVNLHNSPAAIAAHPGPAAGQDQLSLL